MKKLRGFDQVHEIAGMAVIVKKSVLQQGSPEIAGVLVVVSHGKAYMGA